jgi:hypothetical protein
MTFLNSLNFAFKRKPKSPTEFVKRYIRDSKKSRVQLEIIRDNEVLIQVDYLEFTPSWFKVFKVDSEKYKNGYVIFFILDQEEIEKNPKYILYKNSNLELMELEEMLDKTPIKTFAKFVKSTNDPIKLGKEMKEVIDSIFTSTEKDPEVLFNLRYLDQKG